MASRLLPKLNRRQLGWLLSQSTLVYVTEVVPNFLLREEYVHPALGPFFVYWDLVRGQFIWK